jgi:hypothetical protein
MQEENVKIESHDFGDEIIDVEFFVRENREIPLGRRYRVKIGDEYYIFDHHIVTGRQIIEKTGAGHPECHWLYQKLKHGNFERIEPSQEVNLAKHGIEHFIIKPPEVFYYFVDEDPETTDQKHMTPAEILHDADIKPASDYYLVRIYPDGQQHSYRDTPHEPIKMECPPMKFISCFKGETPVS